MQGSLHSFYIPVMGVSFTIDTPVKVAKYGISSVIPLSDDQLLEQMREMFCNQYNFSYAEIGAKEHDSRAKRISAYLNVVNDIVNLQIIELKNASFDESPELNKFFKMLPDDHIAKDLYKQMKETPDNEIKAQLQADLKKYISAGGIDVNIMTKVDSMPTFNFHEYTNEDAFAHAALRGFATSDLSSSVIFSAGLNTRLYSYIENFKDFFPDDNQILKKKIILKVSDFRSAQVQGKFLAKKGLWVSEYRVESGLNCGGHAFATDGFLLGPIMEEFKTSKEALSLELFDLYSKALEQKGYAKPSAIPDTLIGVQGGIGTSNEREFLVDYFRVDGTGWGSPFLLVPEATTVDNATIEKLEKAKKEDLYLSDVSPLGIPINNLKDNTKDQEKLERAKAGKPGSPCVKKYLTYNKEFTHTPICTASFQYQKHKIEELKSQNLSEEEFDKSFNQIIEKVCLCEGLGASAVINNKLEKNGFSTAVAICPGPNIAWFSKTFSLEEMLDHIYGRTNVLNSDYRPNMFINELSLYFDYYNNKILPALNNLKSNIFNENLLKGISFYKKMVDSLNEFNSYKDKMLNELNQFEKKLMLSSKTNIV